MSSSFYVENGVGKRVVDAINLFSGNHGWSAKIQHEIHPQMQLPQHGDEWWIADATKKGYVIITCDLGIVRTPTERQAAEDVRARIIGFARANYSGWQMIAALSHHWAAVEKQLGEPGPWFLKIYPGTTAPTLI